MSTQWELTPKIRDACKHILAAFPNLEEETKIKIEDLLKEDKKSISRQNLNELSYHLKRIPSTYEGHKQIQNMKWVHDLIEGSQIYQPITIVEKMDHKKDQFKQELQVKDEFRRYKQMTKNVVTDVDRDTVSFQKDMKAVNQQLSIVSEIVIMAVVMFMAGYWIFNRTFGSFNLAIIGGAIFGTVGLLVESWLFIIRSYKLEEQEKKKSVKEAKRLASLSINRRVELDQMNKSK